MPQKPSVQERFGKHDREIAAIRKLVLTGMKMLVTLTASQRETDKQRQILIRCRSEEPTATRNAR